MAGGIRVIAIYAQRLQQFGHEVTIVSVPPMTTPLKQKLKSVVTTGRWPRPPARPASHLDGLGVEHRMLERWRPITDNDVPDGDVVIATWWETAEWVAALSRRKGTKVYFVQHHEIFPYLPIERCRATYALPLHKIVVARWLKQVMKTSYGDEAVDLVPNSVDRNQFFAPVRGKQQRPTVGFLYAVPAFKGVDVTLAALRLVARQVPDLRIICFGAEAPAAELPLPEGVRFVLSPAQDTIRDLYAACDVWMTASRSEGFNLPAMEAMACRTPVVSTCAGWCEEAVVTGRNGVLVDIDDAKGLAEGVQWVLSQSDRDWRTMSSHAFATASAGSWDDSARMFENALLNPCVKAGQITMPQAVGLGRA